MATQLTHQEAPQLTKQDFRRLLGISIFQKRQRFRKDALLMKISNEKPHEALSPFFWFGDAWFADKISSKRPIYCFPSGRIQISDTNHFIRAMAHHCLQEMFEIQKTGPYILGGFCFDAWIIYEIAQCLADMGQHDITLLMIECYTLDPVEERFNAWSHHLKKLSTGKFSHKATYLKSILEGGLHLEDTGSRTEAGALSVEEQVNHLTKLALERYQRRPSKHNIELIFGKESWHSTFYRFGRLLSAGWFKTVPHRFPVHFTPGTHHSILKEPNVTLLAQLVSERIDQREESISPRS